MKILTSLVNDPETLDMLGNTRGELEALLQDLQLDGFEVLLSQPLESELFSEGMLVGNHFYFYPLWIDFVKGNYRKLLEEFKDFSAVETYYRANHRQGFINNLRDELVTAAEAGVEYVVMHVSHMSLEESYTGAHLYPDDIILDEFIALLNQAMEGLELNYKLLFENTWYPGLTLLNKAAALRLIREVQHDKTGFVLDTGHLIHTAPGINDPDAALAYINSTVQALGDLREHIDCIHLNLSLSGDYRESDATRRAFRGELPFAANMALAMDHVRKIDNHGVFNHNGISQFIELVDPSYVVYELSFRDKADLRQKIKQQNSYTNIQTFRNASYPSE